MSELADVEAGLAAYVGARRWFRGKARPMHSATLAEVIPLPIDSAQAWLAIVRIGYTDGGADEYALPLLLAEGDRAEELKKTKPHLVVRDRGNAAIVDALGDARALRALLGLVEKEATVRHRDAVLRFRKVQESFDARADAEPRPVDAEQSNTSIIYGNSYILKLIRKIDEGISADLEMGEFLTRAGYAHAPAVAGAIDLARKGGEPATLAILHRFVPNRGDAWAFFLERLARRLDRPYDGRDALGDDRALVKRLAERVAEMHVALASRTDIGAFAPEPLPRAERARLADAVRASLREVVARGVKVEGQEKLDERIESFVNHERNAAKTRIHGDLHLGQILVNGEDFVLIDFEGEPLRSLEERKSKRSPLADVAGLLRSLHYAAVTAARAKPDAAATANAWHAQAAQALEEAYLAGVRGQSFLPARAEDVRALLDFYLLEKCLYEVHYEMNNRPDWLAIPLAGLAELIERADAP